MTYERVMKTLKRLIVVGEGASAGEARPGSKRESAQRDGVELKVTAAQKMGADSSLGPERKISWTDSTYCRRLFISTNEEQ